MPRCRPFKLIDIMIVIASAAIGMPAMRPMWDRLQMLKMASPNGIPWQVYAGTVRIGLTMALLGALVAYNWIRLIPPRPPWRDLIRQPGVLFWELLIGLSFPLLALSAFVPIVPPINMIFALALGLSWFVACRRYRSRAEPGWIEVAGRSVGVGLVVAIAVG